MESENEALPLPKIDAVFKTKNSAKWDAWKVLEFRVHEQLAFPYNATVDVVAPSKGVSFKDLLGKSCVLVLTRGANHKRFFKGLVHRVEQSMDPGNVRAQIGFAPALWALQHGKDSRVFEDATAPQIIEEVANEALEPFERTIRLSLTRSYAKREICTQYQESDWNFILRLMVDEGIFFYFDEGKEESDPETAVFVDSNDSCPYIDTMSPVRAPTRPAPTPVQPSTWIGVSVVWDDSGEPVADLPVVIEPPRGGSTMKATRSDGSVRVDPIDPGPSEVRCRFSGLKYSECVEFVGVGDGPPATRGRGAAATKSSPQGDGPRAIVKVTRRRVRANDTLESIAREEGIPRKDLATFNWGTDGADGKDDTGKAVFTGETRPGTILIPKLWRLPGLAGARVHTIRVRPIPERLQLKFHLHYDLKAPHAEDDIIILETEDGGWRQKVPVASLAEVEPHYVEAVFFDPPMDGRFNLLKDPREDPCDDSLLALGLLGDVAATPLLVTALLDGKRASTAALALYLITGARLADANVEPESAPGISTSPDLWGAFLRDYVKQMVGGGLHRLGEPSTARTLLRCLGDRWLPLDVRRLIADELTIRFRVDVAYAPDMLARDQRAALSKLAHALGGAGAGARAVALAATQHRSNEDRS